MTEYFRPLFAADWTPPDADLGTETHPFSRWESVYVGDVQVIATRYSRRMARFWLSIAPLQESRFVVPPRTSRQRRLCARTGHPTLLTASWWESGDQNGARVRGYRHISVCARCGAEQERA